MKQEVINPNWTIESLKTVLSPLLKEVRGTSERSFFSVSTDTRHLAAGEIFVALRGERFDGHDYALEAEKRGAGVLVLDHSVGASCPEIIVKDTLEAYGALACAWRKQFHIPLICVTGSNGKTTTTQMIGSILREAASAEGALCTEGNLNNEIGVPKMLLKLCPQTRLAVIEAGMNHPGEMARLAGWIRPSVVVVTNAQREHQAYIDGIEGSARENAMAIVALPEEGTAVLPLADPCFKIWHGFARARGCFLTTYSAKESDAQICAIRRGTSLVIRTPQGNIETTLQMAGEHAVHDAAAAAAAAMAAGVDLGSIARGIAAFKPVKGRGRMHFFENGTLLIDESYNANPDSMRAAIDVLAQMPSPRILVIGEMGELGDKSDAYHREIVHYARSKGIERLLSIGEKFRSVYSEFGENSEFFESREALCSAVQQCLISPCSLLVKASHYMRLDLVVDAALSQNAMTDKTKEK